MAAKSEKLYELRKQIKKLNSFKGSGTQLISVYIPAGSAVHEMTGKLREETSQASNIKSKQTRTNVQGALEKIIHHLKIFKKTPRNGLVVFAGNISDNPAKVDIQLFSLEPPEPLNIGTYRCDSSFFLEPLEDMLESKDSYGIVVLDGRDASLAIVKGTNINVVKKLHSTAHAKIRKGGQCLAAGTLVMKGDGEFIDIENVKAGSQVMGIDFQLSKSIQAFASDYFVTPAKHSVILRTKGPSCEIRATSYHRFFVSSEFGIKEKFAKDITKTDRLVMARKINCKGKKLETGFIPKKKLTLDSKERLKLKKIRIKLGLSQKRVAEILEITQTLISHLETGKPVPVNVNIRKLYKLYGLKLNKKYSNKGTPCFPGFWNKELGKLFGIICSEGYLNGEGIIIHEDDEKLAKEYCSLIKDITGIDAKIKEVDKEHQQEILDKKTYYEIRIPSIEFVEGVKHIAPEIISEKSRDIPSAVTKCNDAVVSQFLAGIYDSEGFIQDNRIEIVRTTRSLIQKVHLLLLRFGIISSFSEKQNQGDGQWTASISDHNSIIRFKEQIGFTQNDKKRKLNSLCKKQSKQEHIDQIPIDGGEVYRLAKQLGLKASDFHDADSFFENKKPLGRMAFKRNILSVFEKNLKSKKGRRIYEYLRNVFDSDITLATIKEKILVKNKEPFYDITIPQYSNFIANGFVVHNSARRYERLIEEQIEKYYQRVGEAMDEAFLNRVKGIMVGGPGPTKDSFLKMKPFNYQHQILGSVDTGYTDEYGVREVLSKSENILAEQEAVKEKVIVERFIKEVVNDGLATYGEAQVRNAILSRQAGCVMLSEGLAHSVGSYKCPSCGSVKIKIFRDGAEEKIDCDYCNSAMKLREEKDLIDDLDDLARANNIEVEIISTNTVEGSQFLTGFGGIGAFLRYK